MRPGQLLTAVTYAGWGLCFAALIVRRWLDRSVRRSVALP